MFGELLNFKQWVGVCHSISADIREYEANKGTREQGLFFCSFVSFVLLLSIPAQFVRMCIESSSVCGTIPAK
jgi:hypothetical protein